MENDHAVINTIRFCTWTQLTTFVTSLQLVQTIFVSKYNQRHVIMYEPYTVLSIHNDSIYTINNKTLEHIEWYGYVDGTLERKPFCFRTNKEIL